MSKEINISISIDDLKLMPAGKIMGAYEIEDMDGNIRQVLKIRWTERWDTGVDCGTELRTSYFALDNGEYCGETF